MLKMYIANRQRAQYLKKLIKITKKKKKCCGNVIIDNGTLFAVHLTGIFFITFVLSFNANLSSFALPRLSGKHFCFNMICVSCFSVAGAYCDVVLFACSQK